MLLRWWLLSIYLCWFSSLHAAKSVRSKQVLMIVLDGFRWDYIDLHDLATFRDLRQQGTRVPSFLPEEPTLCFPNFYSLFTGQEPLKHGIVANSMVEPSTGRTFLGGVTGDWADANWWNRSEPIWIGAKRQNRRVALFTWPTCNLPVFSSEYKPDRCEEYREFGNEVVVTSAKGNSWEAVNVSESRANESVYMRLSAVQFKTDLMNAVAELRNGTELVGVFTDLVDVLGHTFGPEREEFGNALRRELEPSLQYLLEALGCQENSDCEPLSDSVNVVMLSDHGMSSLRFNPTEPNDEPSTIDLSHFWRNSDVLRTFEGGAYVSIYPKEEIARSSDSLASFVKGLRELMWPHQKNAVTFYTRAEMIAAMQRWNSAAFEFSGPTTFRVLNVGPPTEADAKVDPLVASRIAPLVAIAQPGWFLKTRSVRSVPRYSDRYARGWHGYDAQNSDMWGLFLAFGPDFEPNRLVQANNYSQTGYLRSRDAYLLLARLLEIEPMPHSASADRVDFVLRRTRPTMRLQHMSEMVAANETLTSGLYGVANSTWLCMLLLLTLLTVLVSAVVAVMRRRSPEQKLPVGVHDVLHLKTPANAARCFFSRVLRRAPKLDQHGLSQLALLDVDDNCSNSMMSEVDWPHAQKFLSHTDAAEVDSTESGIGSIESPATTCVDDFSESSDREQQRAV